MATPCGYPVEFCNKADGHTGAHEACTHRGATDDDDGRSTGSGGGGIFAAVSNLMAFAVSATLMAAGMPLIPSVFVYAVFPIVMQCAAAIMWGSVRWLFLFMFVSLSVTVILALHVGGIWYCLSSDGVCEAWGIQLVAETAKLCPSAWTANCDAVEDFAIAGIQAFTVFRESGFKAAFVFMADALKIASGYLATMFAAFK